MPASACSCCLLTGPNHLYPNQTAAVSMFGRTVYTCVEGDGMLHATYFRKDDEGNWKVSYKNKYVESETFLMEKKRNKKMFIPTADGDPTAILAAFVLNMVSQDCLRDSYHLPCSPWICSFLGYDGDGESRIGVMPRYGDAESVSWFTVRNHCSFHIINCFEDGDEVRLLRCVVVRGCRTTGSVIPGPDHTANKAEWYRRAYLQPNEESHSFDPAVDGVVFSRPYQWRLSMRTGAVKEGYLTGKEIAMDFPAINLSFTGLRNRYAYAQVVDSEASSKLGDDPQILRNLSSSFICCLLTVCSTRCLSQADEEFAKVEYHELGDGEYCTGAQFVQKQEEGTEEEDDGWLVCYVHDERSNTSKVTHRSLLGFKDL
ncbi:hypothetical protein BHM03_00004473 [Ensete ventricosum]|uniref:Uncharacterized protein n=1 Tax=Ensete ventricosum TaxID=4639 RepID=A0A445MAL7_ENSVE|nr:hypothetical protein BHM03_00004473 [Ensete ventricosum]